MALLEVQADVTLAEGLAVTLAHLRSVVGPLQPCHARQLRWRFPSDLTAKVEWIKPLLPRRLNADASRRWICGRSSSTSSRFGSVNWSVVAFASGSSWRAWSCPSRWWRLGCRLRWPDHAAMVEIWAGVMSLSGGVSSAIALYQPRCALTYAGGFPTRGGM